MRKSLNFIFLSVLFVSALFLVSCDREPYPMGMVEEPKNPPAYDVGTDINKSPAVGVTPIS